MIQTLFGSLEEPEKRSIFGRMKEAVSRTRETLAERIENVVALTHEVDEAALEELEQSLLASDLGLGTTTEIIDALRARVKRHEIHNGAELKELLKTEIQSILDAREEQNFFKPRYTAPPLVIMMVGVNGTGKTTTTENWRPITAARVKRFYWLRRILSALRLSNNWRSGGNAPAWR